MAGGSRCRNTLGCGNASVSAGLRRRRAADPPEPSSDGTGARQASANLACGAPASNGRRKSTGRRSRGARLQQHRELGHRAIGVYAVSTVQSLQCVYPPPPPARVQRTIKSSKQTVVGHAGRYPMNPVPKPGTQLIPLYLKSPPIFSLLKAPRSTSKWFEVLRGASWWTSKWFEINVGGHFHNAGIGSPKLRSEWKCSLGKAFVRLGGYRAHHAQCATRVPRSTCL